MSDFMDEVLNFTIRLLFAFILFELMLVFGSLAVTAIRLAVSGDLIPALEFFLFKGGSA